MRLLIKAAMGALALGSVALAAEPANAQVGFGFSFGTPYYGGYYGPYYRGYWGPRWGFGWGGGWGFRPRW